MRGARRARTAIVRVIVAAAAAAALQAGAQAANYHYGETLRCSDCHVSHASLRHDESGGASVGELSPARYLAKAASVTELCLQCHDNQLGTPDVLGSDVNNPSEQYDGSERAGGQFAEDDADNWKAHNLPGQGGTSAGECTVCHDPHGNTNYRNLRTADDTQEGPVAYVDPAAAGLDKYKRSSIGYARNIGDRLCGRCHDFGTPESVIATGGNARYHRHPSSGSDLIVTLGAAGAHADAAHWVQGEGSGFLVDRQQVSRVPFVVSSATSFASATTVSPDNEVFCLSCHKAHGSVHAFGLIWPYGTDDGPLGASGCNQCHNISRV